MPGKDESKREGFITKARKFVSDNPEAITLVAGAGLTVAALASRRARFSPAISPRFAAARRHYPNYKLAVMNANSLTPTTFCDPFMQSHGAKPRYVMSPANLGGVSRDILNTVDETHLPISQLDIVYTDLMQRSASVASIRTKDGIAAVLQVSAPLATGSDAMTRALLGHQLKHEFLGHVVNRDYETGLLLHGASLLPVIYGVSSLATHMPYSVLFATGSLIARQAALNSWNRFIERRADEAAIRASTDRELIAAKAELGEYVKAEERHERVDSLIQGERTGLASTRFYQEARKGVKTLFQEYPTATSRAKRVEQELKQRESNGRRKVKHERRARDIQSRHRAIAAPKRHTKPRGKSSNFRPR